MGKHVKPGSRSSERRVHCHLSRWPDCARHVEPTAGVGRAIGCFCGGDLVYRTPKHRATP